MTSWKQSRSPSLILLALILACTPVAHADDPPEVVDLYPPNGATDVKPGTLELKVTFDRDMSSTAHSICGGGPSFPEVVGKPSWKDKRTFVLKVRLKADHSYSMSLNCQSFMNFRSAKGVALQPVPWQFSTAEKAPKRNKDQRKKLNRASLKQLMAALENHYSYYELRKIDWKALEKKHRKKLRTGASTRTWIKRAAHMLAEAKDMHIWIDYEGQSTWTYKRKIKTNFDLEGVKTILPDLAQRNRCVFTARTKDRIGYLLIGTLSRDRKFQLAQVQDFLAEFRRCKGLVLDLRPNGGGDERLARDIAAWFIDGKKVYAKHVVRDPDAKSGFTPPMDRVIEGHTDPKRYRGPVAVLTGPSIMSSCEAFVLMMKQGENVKLIGAKTYGSSGNPKPHALDNGAVVMLPSWKALRPDGTCFEGEGLKPDLRVKAKPTAFKTGDPVLERALEYLREESGS